MRARVKSGGERLVGLDVLRGFAAVAVMVHHHGQYYDELYPGRAPLPVNFFAGHFGVELFFIISGFVILMTAERAGSRARPPPRSRGRRPVQGHGNGRFAGS